MTSRKIVLLAISFIFSTSVISLYAATKKSAEECAKWIAEEMAGAIKVDLPLKVDISVGPSRLTDK